MGPCTMAWFHSDWSSKVGPLPKPSLTPLHTHTALPQSIQHSSVKTERGSAVCLLLGAQTHEKNLHPARCLLPRLAPWCIPSSREQDPVHFHPEPRSLLQSPAASPHADAVLLNSARPSVGQESSGAQWSASGVGSPVGWAGRMQEQGLVKTVHREAALLTCAPAARGPVRRRGAGTRGPGLRCAEGLDEGWDPGRGTRGLHGRIGSDLCSFPYSVPQSAALAHSIEMSSVYPNWGLSSM